MPRLRTIEPPEVPSSIFHFYPTILFLLFQKVIHMKFRLLTFCIIIVALGFVTPSYAEEASPRVATFKADITLPIGHLCYSSYEPVETIEHPLFAKGIILEDGKDRYVICAFDWCEICNGSHEDIRKRIAEAVGTTPERVAVQCVHQHTAPMAIGDAQRLLNETENPPKAWDLEVLDELFGRVAKAAGEAVEKLQPFDQVGTSQAKVDRVASNRRIPRGDGTVETRFSSCTDARLCAAPEGLVDPMLKTITLARDGQPIVRLHYYAVHPQSFYGDTRLSYDFVGIARERLEKEDGVPQIYFTGCSGDIAAGKYNNRTPQARDELTERLFDGMQRSVAATKYQKVGPITWRTASITAAAKDPDASDRLNETMSDKDADRHQRIYAAQELVFLKRLGKPFLLSSLEMGDVSIVHLPGEPCIAYQFHAQAARPEGFVAVAGYADCGCGYICTENMFPEGGYEPTASSFAPEVEKPLRTAIDSLLGK